MLYDTTLLILLLWDPYMLASYLRMLVQPSTIPQAYLSASVCLTFMQAGINTIVCFLFNRELGDCFCAQFLHCQSPQVAQDTLRWDLNSSGL